MPYEPIVPEGQHLGTSRETDGAVVGHLFDDETNQLKGHAAWQWVDESSNAAELEDEPQHEPAVQGEVTADHASALIVAGILLAIVVTAPPIKRWITGTVIPAAKSALTRITTRRVAASTEEVEAEQQPQAVAQAETVVARSTVTMSREEWWARYRAMLAAGAFAQEQLDLLSIAQINDQQLEATPSEQLTAEQFANQLQAAFEANPAALDDETSGEFVRMLRKRSTEHPQRRRRQIEP